MAFNSLYKITFLSSVILVIFLSLSGSSFACGIATVWSDSNCGGGEPLKVQTWAWGGPVCFIKDHPGYYMNYTELKGEPHGPSPNPYCKKYSDVAWYLGEAGYWPSGANEGDICRVIGDFPLPFYFCAVSWGGNTNYRWDPEEIACVKCDGKLEVEMHKCSSGPFTTDRKCEQACGAAEICDEHFPEKDIVGYYNYETYIKPLKCNVNCQPYEISCYGDECGPGYSCCKSGGKCIPNSAYCGEPGLQENQCNKNPTWFRDVCKSDCTYDLTSAGDSTNTGKNYVCWSRGNCNADPDQCHGREPGANCITKDGQQGTCKSNCQCMITENCESDSYCKGNYPFTPKCCKKTGECLPDSNSGQPNRYCGEPGTANGKFCCNDFCGYGEDDDVGQCDCTDSNCNNGYCENTNNCYYGVSCRDGSWIGDLDTGKSCPVNSDPCKILLDIAASAINTACDDSTANRYEPVADTNKDRRININDVSEIGKHRFDTNWCTDRLENYRKNPCTNAIAPYKYYCYYNGRATCGPSGWTCTYDKENCPFSSGCGTGYSTGSGTCYYNIECNDVAPPGFTKLPNSNFWVGEKESLNSKCSGDIQLTGKECTANGPIFTEFNCNQRDDSYPKPDGGYKILDYGCKNGNCVVLETKYEKTAAVSVYGLKDTADRTEEWVSEYKCPCDIDKDSRVNIRDIAIAAKAFGKSSGQTGFKPEADLDKNNVINIIDLSKIALAFGAKTDGECRDKCKV